ncbi:hypothetical protein BC832DRAFT_569636, partial [Gaertneriomyces semiglobifer]
MGTSRTSETQAALVEMGSAGPSAVTSPGTAKFKLPLESALELNGAPPIHGRDINIEGHGVPLPYAPTAPPPPSPVADHSSATSIPRSPSFKAALSDPILSRSLHDAAPRRSYDLPNSPISAAKQKFEKCVRRYYYQLALGCGDATCTHKLCASCKIGPRLTPEAAAIMAVQLASRPRVFYCPRIPADVALPESLSPFASPTHSPRMSRSVHLEKSSADAHFRQHHLEKDHRLGSGASESSAFKEHDEVSTSRTSSLAGPAPSQPFLSSLLSSSPFASLFTSPIQASSSMRRSHSTSEILDQQQPELPSEVVLGRSLREPKEDGSFLGLRWIKRLVEGEHKDTLLVKSRSTTDLPDRTFCDTPHEQPVTDASLDDPPFHAGILSTLHFPSAHVRSRSTPLQHSDAAELSLKYLNLPLLRSAVATYQDTGGDPQFLVNVLRTVFADGEALGRSFLYENESASEPQLHRHPSGLDVVAVGEAYKLILHLEPKETFMNPLINALEILLARLVLNRHLLDGSRLWLRVLLIVLENPLLSNRNSHDSLLKNVCLIIGGIPTSSRKILIKWFARYEPSRFAKVVQLFQQYLVDHFYPSPKPDNALVGSVKALQVLCAANELSESEAKIPLSAFYNEPLCRRLNFKEEYKIWKRVRDPSTTDDAQAVIPEFTFFNYPFLFHPIAKTRIMRIDAMVQMSLEFEDAFVHQALVVHAQRFLPSSPSVTRLERELKHATNPFLVLEVRREHLVEDVLAQVAKKASDLKKPLKVRFVEGGEEGMDQGGVQKEFFQVIMSKLLDTDYGIFIEDEETHYCWINPASLESHRQYELVGIIIGLAVYNGIMLNTHFPPLMYKKLLDESVTLDDFTVAWPTLGRGLRSLLEWENGDVADIFCRTFETSYDFYGTVKTFPLIHNGDNILVTNETREEYVRLFIDHYVNTIVQPHFSALKKGFLQVCGGRPLKMCRASELQ